MHTLPPVIRNKYASLSGGLYQKLFYIKNYNNNFAKKNNLNILSLSFCGNRESLLLGESLLALQNQRAVQVHATSITIQLHGKRTKILTSVHSDGMFHNKHNLYVIAINSSFTIKFNKKQYLSISVSSWKKGDFPQTQSPDLQEWSSSLLNPELNRFTEVRDLLDLQGQVQNKRSIKFKLTLFLCRPRNMSSVCSSKWELDPLVSHHTLSSISCCWFIPFTWSGKSATRQQQSPTCWSQDFRVFLVRLYARLRNVDVLSI